jgi:hypothetical protein
VAKALCWAKTDTERRKLGEQIGLDSPAKVLKPGECVPYSREVISASSYIGERKLSFTNPEGSTR